ncbi:hypothetical protein L1887_32368 [Cichorium endivia]|nr:hypothetical protein L1887_32368 [Cichorium endivia]
MLHSATSLAAVRLQPQALNQHRALRLLSTESPLCAFVRLQSDSPPSYLLQSDSPPSYLEVKKASAGAFLLLEMVTARLLLQL